MKRIALILENPLNKGDMAVVISTVETLKTIIPNSQISVFSSSPQGIDKYKNHSINFTKSPWKTKAETIFINLIMSGLKCISIIGMYTANFLLKPFGIAGFRDPLDYDLFIENGTDIHTYGGMSFYYSLYPLLLNMLFRKPLVIYAESLGPFKNNMERSLMKFILNRASLITIRESISYAFLQELKLKNSAYLTADPAFLLKSCCQERVDKIFIEEGINDIRKPVIGIFVSELICRRAFGNHVKPKERRRKYVMLISKIADYIIEKLNTIVIFFPHVTIPGSDDRVLQEEIYQIINNKSSVFLVRGDYTADELKGVIGMCQMVISCRMHPAIASTSQCIPTIAMAYSHKFKGVLGNLCGGENSIIDITLNTPERVLEEICLSIENTWHNREKIKRELINKIPEIKRRALSNAELVRDLLIS